VVETETVTDLHDAPHADGAQQEAAPTPAGAPKGTVEGARRAATVARIKTILDSEGAKAFPKLAARLAYESDIPAEQAVAQLSVALADLPAQEARPSRMDMVPRLAITAEDFAQARTRTP